MKHRLVLAHLCTDEILKPGQVSYLPEATQTAAMTWHGSQPSWNAREHWTRAWWAELLAQVIPWLYWLQEVCLQMTLILIPFVWPGCWLRSLDSFPSHAWFLFSFCLPLIFTCSPIRPASLIRVWAHFCSRLSVAAHFLGIFTSPMESDKWVTCLIGTFWKTSSSWYFLKNEKFIKINASFQWENDAWVYLQEYSWKYHESLTRFCN